MPLGVKGARIEPDPMQLHRFVAKGPDGGQIGYVRVAPRGSDTLHLDAIKVDPKLHKRGLGSALFGTVIDAYQPKLLTMSLSDTNRDVLADALPPHWPQMKEKDFQRVAEQAVKATPAYRMAFARGYRFDSLAIRRNPKPEGYWDRFTCLFLEMKR